MRCMAGINPERDEHSRYLEQLCDDFEHHVIQLVQRAVVKATREENSDPLYMEALQHCAFRQAKCKSFNGRETVLQVRSVSAKPYCRCVQWQGTRAAGALSGRKPVLHARSVAGKPCCRCV